MGAGLENVSFSYILPYAKCDLNLTIAEQGVQHNSPFSKLGLKITVHFYFHQVY